MKTNSFLDKLVSKVTIYLVIITFLLLVIFLMNPKLLLICVCIFVFVIGYALLVHIIKKNEIKKYIDELTFNIDVVTKDTLLNFQMPLVILKSDGNIIWNNSNFDNLFQENEREEKIAYILKMFKDEHKKEEGNKFYGQIEVENRIYDIFANIVSVEQKNLKKQEYIMLMYFLDRTEFVKLKTQYDNARLCVGVISIDNYDELIQTISEERRAQLSPTVGKEIRNWISKTNGVVIDKETTKFIVVFERKYLQQFKEQKFSILEDIKKIDSGAKMPVTISGGIATEYDNIIDKYNSAFATLDVALGRGGDQIVLKQDGKYEFFGGQTVEVEKHTKVKSRVVAQALKELMQNSRNVIILGHKDPDVDCIGAGIGIYKLAMALGKEANIVLEGTGSSLKNLMEKLREDEKYNNLFLNKSEASNKVGIDTLVVVVDTHRKDYVECPQFIDEVEKVVVIDHHRRVVDAISNNILTFQEVYASSTCELVTEILQYVDVKVNLEPIEAEALYAGIMVDTKSFTLKSGVRTFEAAAYLRKMGADISNANQLFKTDFNTYVIISEVVKNAEIIKEHIAISICPTLEKDTVLINAQASDELINIEDIFASFVLCEENGKIYISGRSVGNINVQVILEQLGGGGHITMAGAQLVDMTIEEAKQKLIEVINSVDIKI